MQLKAKLIWVWVCNYVLLPVWQLSVVTLREREIEGEGQREEKTKKKVTVREDSNSSV